MEKLSQARAREVVRGVKVSTTSSAETSGENVSVTVPS